MALVTCPDCGKQHSDAAPACPNCGRPNALASKTPPKAAPAPAAKNVTAGQAGCVILIAIVFFTWLGTGRNHPSTFTSTSAPVVTTPSRPQGPQLEVVKWSWGEEYGFVKAEGQVKNITDSSLKSVEAVVSFYDSKGGFITSADALIDFNPVLPGQTSPFSVLTTHNPAMKKASVEFKYLMGGTIAHRER